MVRCGTCRERFQAHMLSASEKPSFDPAQAFIEPLSDGQDKTSLRIDDFIEDNSEIDFRLPSDKALPSAEANDGPQSFTAAYYEFTESLNSELSIQMVDEDDLKVSPSDIARLEKSIQQGLQKTSANLTAETDDKVRDDQLIDEVDALIENKLVTKLDELPTTSESRSVDKAQVTKQPNKGSRKAKSYDELFRRRVTNRSRILRLIAVVFLGLVAAILSAVLLYQLWVKQVLPGTEQPVLTRLLKPLQKQLDIIDVEIPIRRNLRQLELLSARTEAHPTRPSTVLLRVSLVNRAEISQPLPWLELSLSDADGRLVARRNLAPADYIFNNRIDQQIGAKQLKKVTIELLAFPKRATGYEIRLLNK